MQTEHHKNREAQPRPTVVGTASPPASGGLIDLYRAAGITPEASRERLANTSAD